MERKASKLCRGYRVRCLLENESWPDFYVSGMFLKFVLST